MILKLKSKSFVNIRTYFYPQVQVFIEECKYVVKGKNISKYIIDDIEISSDSGREK